MTARVLLVTGSRALSDTPQAEEWARAELAKRIGPATLSRVIAGDARGPDSWSQHPSVMWERWYLTGEVWCFLADAHYSVPDRRWLPSGTPLPSTAEAWKQRALARNAAMVERTARTHKGNVAVVALKAPWSRTDGTGHTAGVAARHGLTVEVLTCPEEYGPRGSK